MPGSSGGDIKFTVENQLKFTADSKDLIRELDNLDRKFSSNLSRHGDAVSRVYEQMANSMGTNFSAIASKNAELLAKQAMHHAALAKKQIANNQQIKKGIENVTSSTAKWAVANQRAIETLTELSRVIAVVQGPLGPIAGRITAAASAIRVMGVAGLSTGLAFAAVGKTISAALPAAVDLQMTMGTLSAATDNAAKSFALVIEESRRVGQGYSVLAKSYSQLAAAAKGTALEGEQTVKIFKAINTASLALRLDVYSTAGAIKALEQMISKGTVSSEELRQQLGERLPGAFRLAADALGVTTKELSKMLQQGKVLAEDLLPKLADQLNKKYAAAAEQASASLGIALRRLQNEMSILFGRLLDQDAMSVLGMAVNKLADALQVLSDHAAVVSHIFSALVVSALGFAIKKLVTLTGIARLFTTAFSGVAKGFSSVGVSATTFSKTLETVSAALSNLSSQALLFAGVLLGNPKKALFGLAKMVKDFGATLLSLPSLLAVVRRAFIALFAIIRAHPIGALLTAISLLGSAFSAFGEEYTKTIDKITKTRIVDLFAKDLAEAEKKLAALQSRQKELQKIALSGKASSSELEALKQVNSELVRQQKIVDDLTKTLERKRKRASASALFTVDKATQKAIEDARKYLSDVSNNSSKAEAHLQRITSKIELLRAQVAKTNDELNKLRSIGQGKTETALRLETRIIGAEKVIADLDKVRASLQKIVDKEKELSSLKLKSSTDELRLNLQLLQSEHLKAFSKMSEVEIAKEKQSVELAKNESERRIAILQAELQHKSKEEIAAIKKQFDLRRQIINENARFEVEQIQRKYAAEQKALENHILVSKDKIKLFTVQKGTLEEAELKASIARKELANKYELEMLRASSKEELSIIRAKYAAEAKLLDAKLNEQTRAASIQSKIHNVNIAFSIEEAKNSLHKLQLEHQKVFGGISQVELLQAKKSIDLAKLVKEEKVSLLQAELEHKSASEIASIKQLFAIRKQIVAENYAHEKRLLDKKHQEELASLNSYLSVTKDKLALYRKDLGDVEKAEIKASIARKELESRYKMDLARATSQEEIRVITIRYAAEKALQDEQLAHDIEVAKKKAAIEEARNRRIAQQHKDTTHRLYKETVAIKGQLLQALNFEAVVGPSVEQKIARLKDEFAAKKEAISAWFEEQQIMYAGNADKLAQIDAERKARELEALREFEKNKTNILLEEEQKRNEAIAAMKDQVSALFVSKQQADLGKLLLGMEAFYKKFQQLDKMYLEGKLKLFGKLFGTLSGLMESHSRKAFEIGKASAIAETVVNTLAAVVKAWKEFGWPLGAAIGAAIAVAGAAQVAKIANTKFKGGATVSASSPSIASSGGSGSSNVPQTPTTQQAPRPQISLYIQGNVMTQDFVNNQIIPALQDAVTNYDVTLITPQSRNAQIISPV